MISLPIFMLWTAVIGYLVLHISCQGMYMTVVGEATALSIMLTFILIFCFVSCKLFLTLGFCPLSRTNWKLPLFIVLGLSVL